jgi:nucleoside-diphosphate-sugar epimerase
MKIFMTGATGALGPATLQTLVTGGHEVTAVARDDAKAARVRAAGAEPVGVDLFDAGAVRDAVVGAQPEAILHLATNVPPTMRAARKSAWSTHNALRTTATEHLVAAARAAGSRVFVKESVLFSYPDRGEAWIDEDVPPDESITLLQPTLEGERIALDFAGTDTTAVVLRFGLFYGPFVRQTDESLKLARWRMSTVAGKPHAYQSSIYVEDVAAAVAAALDAPTGVYNVCDDEPLTRRAYLDAFSAGFGLPKLRLNPPWLLRLVAGRSARVVTASQRCSNRRFRSATGWAPACPSACEGWAAAGAARAAAREELPSHRQGAGFAGGRMLSRVRERRAKRRWGAEGAPTRGGGRGQGGRPEEREENANA